MTDTMPNLYEFLNVERTAAQDDVIQAFRKKAAEVSSVPNDSPEAARNLKLLGLAYRTLNDPERRKEYDATLPPETPKPLPGRGELTLQRDWRDEGAVEKGDPSDTALVPEEIPEDPEPTDPVAHEAWEYWQGVAREYIDKADRYTPALGAVKILKPLTIDAGKQMILGYDPRFANLIGYINVGENFNILRRMIGEHAGRSLNIRFVETTSLEDWTTMRQAEMKVLRKHTQRVQAKIRANDAMNAIESLAEGVEDWDGVMREMEEWPAKHPAPAPREQAIYIIQQVATIAHTEDNYRTSNIDPRELSRLINKALMRLGELTGLDPTLIALEYFRFRMR